MTSPIVQRRSTWFRLIRRILARGAAGSTKQQFVNDVAPLLLFALLDLLL